MNTTHYNALIEQIKKSTLDDIRKRYVELESIVGNNLNHPQYDEMVQYRNAYEERRKLDIEVIKSQKHEELNEIYLRRFTEPLILKKQKQAKYLIDRAKQDCPQRVEYLKNYYLRIQNQLKWMEELRIKEEKINNELRELGEKAIIPSETDSEFWIRRNLSDRNQTKVYFKNIYMNILNDYDKETAKKWALSALSVFKRVEGNRNFSLTVKNNYNDFKAWIDDTLFKIKRTKKEIGKVITKEKRKSGKKKSTNKERKELKEWTKRLQDLAQYYRDACIDTINIFAFQNIAANAAIAKYSYKNKKIMKSTFLQYMKNCTPSRNPNKDEIITIVKME